MGTGKHYSKEVQAEARRLATEEGLCGMEISRRLGGISLSTLSGWKARQGYEWGGTGVIPHPKKSPQEYPQCEELYREGYGMAYICRETGISRTTLRRIGKQLGWVFGTKGRKKHERRVPPRSCLSCEYRQICTQHKCLCEIDDDILLEEGVRENKLWSRNGGDKAIIRCYGE
jgi:transposase-like protein